MNRDEAVELVAFVLGVVLISMIPFSLIMHIMGAHKFDLPVYLLIACLFAGILLAFFRRIASAFGLLKGSKIKLPGDVEFDMDGKD